LSAGRRWRGLALERHSCLLKKIENGTEDLLDIQLRCSIAKHSQTTIGIGSLYDQVAQAVAAYTHGQHVPVINGCLRTARFSLFNAAK
jgi:hypothetical protein